MHPFIHLCLDRRRPPSPPHPLRTMPVLQAIHLSAFGTNVAVVTASGDAFALGKGGKGQLGNGSTSDSTQFVKMLLPAGEQAQAVAVGGDFAVVLTKRGGLVACGADNSMQLGRGRDSVREWAKSDEDNAQISSSKMVYAPLEKTPTPWPSCAECRPLSTLIVRQSANVQHHRVEKRPMFTRTGAFHGAGVSHNLAGVFQRPLQPRVCFQTPVVTTRVFSNARSDRRVKRTRCE